MLKNSPNIGASAAGVPRGQGCSGHSSVVMLGPSWYPSGRRAVAAAMAVSKESTPNALAASAFNHHRDVLKDRRIDFLVGTPLLR